MTFAGIIFDFDGVVVDSERHWRDLDNKFLSELIPGWNKSDYDQFLGRSIEEVHRMLVAEYGLALSQEDFLTQYESLAQKVYEGVAQPLTNLQDVLRLLTAAGKKKAIASSAKRSWVDASLQKYGLVAAFDSVTTADEPLVRKGKPAPDIYRLAARRTGEYPSRLIAIEDSANGIAAAKAAGLYCVGLDNGFNEDQDLSNADAVIHGYRSQSLAFLRNLL